MVITYLKKRRRFNKIVDDIKKIKIQGAKNIAKAALKAYLILPSPKSKKKLLSARPTEPMMQNVLQKTEKISPTKILDHFEKAQEKINQSVFKIIKNKDIIFTHCHSTNVTHSLIHAKNKGKKFEVYNTETRPLFQGRKTAKELSSAGIKVTMFVDSAVGVALSKEQGTKKATKVFIGADALLSKGVVNKIGSETIAQIAKKQKTPVYVIADSWKYSKKNLKLEQREVKEVWNQAPKKLKIKNPAFEFVPKKYITKIITELGTLNYEQFLKKVK